MEMSVSYLSHFQHINLSLGVGHRGRADWLNLILRSSNNNKINNMKYYYTPTFPWMMAADVGWMDLLFLCME
jgi:hypothetical protein